MAESLPRFMFLDEDSQQMHDKRIQTITYYDQNAQVPVKKQKKRINSTFPHGLVPYNSSIFNLEYSNSYGLLLQATENEVVALPLAQLQSNFKEGKVDKNKLEKLEVAGEVFLSPNQQLLAICSNSLVQIVKMSQLPAINVVPVANANNSDRFLWVGDNHLLLWNFLGKAYLLEIDITNMASAKIKQMEEVNQCTGASIVGDSLLIAETRNVKIFDFGQTKAKKSVCLDYEDHENYLYDYSTIIEIFRVNVHGSPEKLNSRMNIPLNDDDILGFVMVYYDDEQQEPDQRFLTFFKGNLLSDDKQFHGNQMFSSSNNNRQVYYEDDTKLSFGVKILYCGYFICISIERCQSTYIVDPFQQLEKLNIFEVNGKTQLKDKQGKPFRGITVLRNMMDFQRKCPQDAKIPVLESITKDYKGQFMTLYFANQQTNLNLTFPPSVIAITQNQLYRKYAVSAIKAIDKDSDKDIIAEMEKIKCSPHIIEPNKKCTGKKDDIKPMKKEEKPKVEAEKKQQKPTPVAEPKKSQQKPSVGQVKKQQKKIQPSIFGSKPTSSSPPNPFSLSSTAPKQPTPFANMFSTPINNTTNNIFSKPLAPGETTGSNVANMLADKINPQINPAPDVKPSTATKPEEKKTQEQGGLFGMQPAGAFSGSFGNFGNTLQTAPSDKQSNGSLFKQNEIVKPSTQIPKQPEPKKVQEQSKPNVFSSSGGFFGTYKKADTALQQPTTQTKINDKKDKVPQTSQKDKKQDPKQDKKQDSKQDKKQDLQKLRLELIQNIHPAIIQIKDSLDKFQKIPSFSNKRTLTQMSQFADKQLDYLKKGDEFYLGAPLNLLLKKAQSLKDSEKYLRWLLDIDRHETSLEKKVEEQLKDIDDELNRAMFFSNVINPQRKRKNKENSEELTLQRIEHVENILLDKRQGLEKDLEQLLGDLRTMISSKSRKKNAGMNSSMLSNVSVKTKRRYNFAAYKQQTEQTPSKIVGISKNLFKSQGRSRLSDSAYTIVQMKKDDSKPLVVLEQFDVIKPVAPPAQPPVSKPPQKFPPSQSMASINQAKGSVPASKSKQKVNVPMVNTKTFDIKEQVAESEEFQNSDVDLVPLNAVRQISHIDTASTKEIGKKQSPKVDAKKSSQPPKVSKGIFGQPSEPKAGEQTGKPSLFGFDDPSKKKEQGQKKEEKKVEKKDEPMKKVAEEKKEEKGGLGSGSLFGNISGTSFGNSGKPTGSFFGFGSKDEKKEDKPETKTQPHTETTTKETTTKDKKQQLPPLDKPKNSAQSQPQIPKILPNNFTLMQPKEEPKKDDKKKQEQPKKPTSLFGQINPSGSGPGLFGGNKTGTSSVFGAGSSLSSYTDEKKAQKANGKGSVFVSSGKQEKKEEKPIETIPKKPQPAATTLNLFSNNKNPSPGATDADIQKQIIESTKKSPEKNTTNDTSKPSPSLFPPRTQQPSTAPVVQPTIPSVQPMTHGIGVPSTGFGAANRFLASDSNQGQNAGGFNPNAMSFGGGQQTQRSFTSVGGDQGGNLFNKPAQNTQGNAFGSSNMFGQNNSSNGNVFGNQGSANNTFQQTNTSPGNMFGQGNNSNQQGSLFNQQNSQNNTFQANQGQGNGFGQNNQGGGMFGQVQGNQGGGMFANAQGGGNFLQNMGNSTQPPPQGVSSNLMAMRK